MEGSPQHEPPTHSPSEIYLPELPQAYILQMPAYAQPYPSQEIVQDQEIVVYHNRARAIGSTIYCAIILAFGVIIFVGIIAIFLLSDATTQSEFIVPLLMYLALWLPIFALGGWITWSVAQFAFKPIPLLTINRQGITIGKAPMLSGFFIKWDEIEAIHTSSFIRKYLCIRPKDTKQFLKRFNILERINRLGNGIIGVSPLAVPQIFLESPIEEVLQQLQVFYAHELEKYRIRLRL